MYHNMNTYQMCEEHQKALRQAAEHHRLVQIAKTDRITPALADTILNCVGETLVRVGSKLQERPALVQPQPQIIRQA